MKKTFLAIMTTLALAGCSHSVEQKTPAIEDFNYVVDQFADMQILRYRVPDIEKLSPRQQELLYYLNEAALQGRDIMYDQNCKYNLAIRQLLEAIYTDENQDKNSANFKALELYLKRVWVSNGIHHHYAGDKFVPQFSQSYFEQAVRQLPIERLPLKEGQDVDSLLAEIVPVIFDPTVLPKRTNQAAGVDLLQTSACNYYEGVSQAEAEAFYDAMKDPNDKEPISYGLNSKLVKRNGELAEDVYKVGGLYSPALEKIVYWLEKAEVVAENDQQKAVIAKLIDYYKSGCLKQFDEYSILWVNDTLSQIDFVNGFTETYGDPLGMKASWESIVNFKNLEATKRTEIISENAQWFEDHSPIDPQFKKEKVRGVSAKVITAAILAGDCYPTTPIGINLPNANWIRATHGSKSVTIENITEAYDEAAQGNGFREEFAWSQREIDLMNDYKGLTDNLHTDLHECLGHGSGKLLPGVEDALKAYGSTIEEARADLFGLYYVADSKMIELGLIPNDSAYKAQYYSYMMNGLMTQQVRIELGKNIEEAHMRNRQLIANWVLQQSQANGDHAIEIRERNGKHYVVINDYEKTRYYYGELLREIQRIRSTGDFAAAQKLVETYAVKIDPMLHKEILSRYEGLHIAPYKGFVNPVYKAEFDKNGVFKTLTIDYTEGYAEQQLRYSRDYSPLTK